MNIFYFEVTDTFGHELNYCWVRRYKINAKSLLGALRKLSKETGLHFRYNGIYYKAKKACVGAYEMENDFGDIENYYEFESL